MFVADFFIVLIFDTEDGDDMFLRNVGLLRAVWRHNPEGRTVHSLCVAWTNDRRYHS
jgi:hypothetical protein